MESRTAVVARAEFPVRSPDWYRSATRWTQLTFTDDDPARYDRDFWVEVMRSTRSNALCLSAGGYMAFYPTQIPFHHRSAHLGDRDPFGEMVESARSLGMHVMARIDPHAVHDDAAQAHPEWLARNEDGEPMPHPSLPGLWLTDAFTTYNRDFMTEVALEIVREYDVDALFANRWDGPKQVSYAEQSERDFVTSTGLAGLPRAGSPPEVWSAYTAWRSRRLSELVVRWDDAVSAVRPHVRFIPNRGASLTRDLVAELVIDRYPMFFVDQQGRARGDAAWGPGRVGKRARGLYPERPVALITSVGPEFHDLRWKDSVADPHELIAWTCDGFAHGALPWFTKFKAECFDTRWVEPLSTAFQLHARIEPIHQALPVAAEVVVLDWRSPAHGSVNPHDTHLATNPHEDGFYQALVEARVPFEFVAREALSAERLVGARVLVVPDAPGLDAQQAALIEDFVARGGSVVAAHDVGIAVSDEGVDLALGDLLGVKLLGGPRGPVKNNYLSISEDHPVADGFEGAQRIAGGTQVITTEVTAGQAVFRFIPDYPDLPMEEVYPRELDGPPAVVVRSHPSGGRTVYCAFNLGEIFWDVLQSDHARLIANAVRWAHGDGAPQVAVEGAGVVDVALRADADRVAVTLVNLTNPMAMRGHNRETLPLPPQTVVLRVPEGIGGAEARLVVEDKQVPVEIRDGLARIRVEAVPHLEVVDVVWQR